MAVTIARETPVGADLALLFQRHTVDMHADTPPESIHMMDASELDIRWGRSKFCQTLRRPKSSQCMF